MEWEQWGALCFEADKLVQPVSVVRDTEEY